MPHAGRHPIGARASLLLSQGGLSVLCTALLKNDGGAAAQLRSRIHLKPLERLLNAPDHNPLKLSITTILHRTSNIFSLIKSLSYLHHG